ncbi:glutamyl-tRNA reductase [Kyrpidia tusciae]|nr:glutamyl-tRNA reductase [Kyrpidia tusciae]
MIEVKVMHILVIGVNHRTAPVEIRERFSIGPEEMEGVLGQLRETRSVLESVILSTCNRTEIYAVVDALHPGEQFLRLFLADLSGLDRADFTRYIYLHVNDAAIHHLFRVAAGLDSMVLGETQILGQVRDAFEHAQAAGNTGAVLNQLFRRAITGAKRGHTETEIGQHAVSVSYAAVELARKVFGSMRDKAVLLIGAGKMGELTATHLWNQGVSRVLVVNRTWERARELADRFSGEAYDWSALALALAEADIVISSTGAPGYVLHQDMVAKVCRRRRQRPLLLIDIAVPRDMDPAINGISDAFLYDIDDLREVVAQNLQERQRAAVRVEDILEEEISGFKQWYNMQEVIPLIRDLREKGMKVQRSVMESLMNKFPDLSERDRVVLHKHTMSIVNQLLRDPILQLKAMATEPEATFYLETVRRLFALGGADDSGTAVEQEVEAREGSVQEMPLGSMAAQQRLGSV